MIPNLPRHLYVLVYKDKNEPLEEHTYCSSCITKRYLNISNSVYDGNCPIKYHFTICIRDRLDAERIKFDNSKHDILATISGCKMRSNECRRPCESCGIFKMIEYIKRKDE